MKARIAGAVGFVLILVLFNVARFVWWSATADFAEVDVEGTSGTITHDGSVVDLQRVVFQVEEDDGFYYQVEAELVGRAEPGDEEYDDYGYMEGLFLYGDVGPLGSWSELVGSAYPIEFSGDGDDANLWLSDGEGFLAARPGQATLTVESIEGTDATLRISGDFDHYDLESFEPGSVPVSVSGTLHARFVFHRCVTETCEDWAPWP